MKVLVACESSGTVRGAFRARGHDSWSCDLLPADDNSPHHIRGDALDAIAQGWDLVIAHPPCTHLASSGAKWFAQKRADGRQQQGVDLFLSIVSACKNHAKSWAIENPVGIMSRLCRKPDQIIQPWQFGHEATKATCLWLENLPLLIPTAIVAKGERHITRSGKSLPAWYNLPPSADRWKIRSKTFPGIADAMAEQWTAINSQNSQ